MPLSLSYPADFARFAPDVLKSFRYTWGGGTHFWRSLRGGVPKFNRDSDGGRYVFFTYAFPEKYHPPIQQEILNRL